MQIQESGEMYLETILILSQTREAVHAIDIANRTGYSKPSVSRAVGILKNGGMISVAEDGAIRLEPPGHEIAARIYERHLVLSDFLERLGVPKDVAAQDACKIEHDISDVSFEALKRHIAAQG